MKKLSNLDKLEELVCHPERSKMCIAFQIKPERYKVENVYSISNQIKPERYEECIAFQIFRKVKISV